MICARGKSKHQKLKLAALAAAARFLPQRGTKGAKIKRNPFVLFCGCNGGWLPLVLLWRRRRQARQSVKADRITSSASLLYFSQTHFHFATYLSGRVPRPSAPKVFPAVTIYRERTVPDRSWTNFVTINRAAQPRRIYGPSRINYVREGPPPKFKIDSAQPFRSSRVFEPIRKPEARYKRSSVPGIAATLHVNTRRREELTQLLKTYRRSYEHRPQVLPSRLPARDSYAPLGQPKRKQIQFAFPEELVWRRVQPPSAIGTHVRESNTSEPNQRESGGAIAETPVQQASSPLGRATQQQITKIDPGLLDRLTDDVIRRVEQRARIERQRRGI
jgi:hypothetical protein